jgi:amidase
VTAVSVPRPTESDILALAGQLAMSLPPPEVAAYRDLVDAALGSYDVVADLYEEHVAPQAPARSHRVPAEGENPLNAWYVRTEISLDVDGPLAGRTVAVKDNVAVAGVPMMNGSRTLEGFVPSEDATVVTRLLAAGATISGKSTCEDLCFSGSSFTSATGPVRNPWQPDRSAGGSSSGSAVLVATGEVDLAVGCDQGGSIRMPAAWCGIVGHKATYGLVPYTGAFPIERTIDHIGPMGRTVPEVALMLQVIAGADGLDPRQAGAAAPAEYVGATERDIRGLRVGLVREGFDRPGLSDPLVDESVREAAEALADAGAVLGEVSVPLHSAGAMDIWNVIATDGAAYQMLEGNGYGMGAFEHSDPEVMRFFGHGRVAHADEISPSVKLVGLAGRYGLKVLGGAHYARARRLVPLLTAAYDAALAEYDVLVMPTIPFLPGPLLDRTAPVAEYAATALGVALNTAPFDATGHPAASVPARPRAGLPVGMMVIGRRFDDETVLRVCAAYERERGPFPTPA